MSPELDKQLVENYPAIFRDRRADPKVTLMCWGFEVGDGWFNLIDLLCYNIQSYLDYTARTREYGLEMRKTKPDYFLREEVPQVIATQVKEKFGTLRFYYEGGDDHIAGMVVLAESLSARICDKCGDKGELRSSNQYWYTSCDTHKMKDKNEIRDS